MDKEKLDYLKKFQDEFKKIKLKNGSRFYHPKYGIGVYINNEVIFSTDSISIDSKNLLRYPDAQEVWKLLKMDGLELGNNGKIILTKSYFCRVSETKDLEVALLDCLSYELKIKERKNG